MKLRLIILGLIYLGINELFLLKYASRLSQSSPAIYLIIYGLVIGLIGFLYLKIRSPERLNKVLFYTLVGSFFMGTIYINITVDGQGLQVDRWSAMHSAIEGLFQGTYPYAELDHLGGRTSNLPGLIGIGIPFYLLGHVGYLQSFCFLVFAWMIYTGLKTYKTRLFALILLMLSPSYLWEIYVKSDLMSNFILLLFFVLWVHQKYLKTNKKFGSRVPIMASILLLTRLTTVIPLCIVLAKKVLKASMASQLRFFSLVLLAIGLLLWACFYHVESYDNFVSFNPFSLQNRQIPILISMMLSLAAVVVSFYVKNLDELLLACTIGLLIPVLIAFTWRIFDLGFSTSLFESGFDISYFNMVMPFLLFVIFRDIQEICRPTKTEIF